MSRRRLERLADKLAPRVRRAFISSIEGIRSSARLAMIERAAERGDVNAVLEELDLQEFRLEDLRRAIEETYRDGGDDMMANLPGRPPRDVTRLAVFFEGRRPRAEAWLAEKSGALIREITDGQRAAVQAVVQNGVRIGRNPRQTALDIVGRVESGRRRGGIVGLTERQSQAIVRARQELTDPEAMPGYFERKRRDKRFDPLVRRAIADGKPVSQADITRILGRYSDRLLQLRGETIARTETIAALNQGRRDAMQQLIERGAITADQVTRVWDATGDARTREDHMLMEGQTVRWGEPFTAPDGSLLMGPGDSSLGASADQVIACRCYEDIRVDYLRGLA